MQSLFYLLFQRWSHYYLCDLKSQFDILHFVDNSHEVIALADEELSFEEKETYPSGL
jgi:hypothetical protein